MKSIYNPIIITLLVMCFGCGNSEKNTTPEPNISDDRIKISRQQFEQNNMALGQLEEKTFPLSIKVNGSIDVPPENKAIVTAITGGYIETIPLIVGDVVKKGQKVATIKNPDFVILQQEYMEVKAQLNYLKSEYERQKTMYDEDVISEKKYLMAESQYNAGNAKYNGLRKQLSMLNISPKLAEEGAITTTINIYAPIGGSITSVNVSKGEYISSRTPILEIIDNTHIHIELSVFEKDIMQIKKNQKVIFSIPEASDKVYNASVHLVGTSIAENRTITVHAHPEDESNRFLTGMFVNAEIVTDTITEQALPEKTLVESDNKYYVLVLDETTNDSFYFKKVKIEKGISANGYSAIKNTNYTTKDTFLVRGAFSIIGD